MLIAIQLYLLPVIHLMDHDMFKFKTHIAYFDNFFNGTKLHCHLLDWMIHTCGTLRTNRIQSDKVLFFSKTGANKGNRGDMKHFKVPLPGSKCIYTTSWYDK
jgi:hypothetical protein